MDSFDQTTIEEVEAMNEYEHHFRKIVSAQPNQAEDVLWQWVPVYGDTEAIDLLSVYLDFPQGDWCSQLSLSSISYH